MRETASRFGAFTLESDNRRFPIAFEAHLEVFAVEVTMFVIQMKNALRGFSAPAAWQTPEKFFI